ncbi:MAG: stage II sporulation protein P [Alistipes sp.]|nr:stage II sporulation protein P [Alistipes sp.]
MKRRRTVGVNRAGILIVLGFLFLFMKFSPKTILSGIVYKMNGISGFTEQKSRSIIHCYLPVVGYVDSHYIETDFLSDPTYQAEARIEYITLTDGESGADSEAREEEDNGALDGGDGAAQVSTVTAPVKFAYNELIDFNSLLSRFYTVTSITELKSDKFNVSEGLNENLTMLGDNSQPQILIFHTHSQEGFADSIPGDPNTSIIGVGSRLAEILSSRYGYNVIHDTTVYDYVNGVLDRSKAYTYAEKGIQSILEQYPTIEVILDVHRDGVSEDIRLVTDVNGKPTAKIMFFNGISYTKVNGDIEHLQNPYIQDNLAMSLQMKLLGETYYPGVLRKIYINGYRYCLHFRAKSMLIEVGAQNNTLEEELNAMEPLADMLNRLLSGEKAY